MWLILYSISMCPSHNRAWNKIKIEYLQPNNIVLQLCYQLLKIFSCQNQLHAFVSFLYNFHLKVTYLIGPCWEGMVKGLLGAAKLPNRLSCFSQNKFHDASNRPREGTAIYGLYRYVPLWGVWFSGSLLEDRVYKSECLGLE